MPYLLSDRAQLVSPIPLITAGEARSHQIAHRSSAWSRVRTGIYVPADRLAAATASERYAIRVHGFLRQHPDAILCLESAAVLHGLPLFNEPKDIHVFDPTSAHSHHRGDVCFHTSENPREIEQVGGARVTSLLDTVVDLARVLSPARAVIVIDSAISPAQGGALTLERLTRRSAEQIGTRGGRRAAFAFESSDALSESPGESLSRLVIAWSGFETPILQMTFAYEGHRDRSDFFFPSSRAIGESDGWQKYQLTDAQKAADALADEKRREDRLRRNGHPFARWDMRDAWQVDPLCDALTAAGVRRERPVEHGLLFSLNDRSRDKPFRETPLRA